MLRNSGVHAILDGSGAISDNERTDPKSKSVAKIGIGESWPKMRKILNVENRSRLRARGPPLLLEEVLLDGLHRLEAVDMALLLLSLTADPPDGLLLPSRGLLRVGG